MRKSCSIVMTYFNRKALLYTTLKTIEKSSYPGDLEIIIVDDGSDDAHQLNDIEKDFSLNIKVLRQDPGNKWYTNPCIPFNVGIKEASGEVIVLQNPECCHVGDVVSCACTIPENTFLSFHAYSLSESETVDIGKVEDISISTLPFVFLSSAPTFEGRSGWYNHSSIRPTAFHFCSAILREDLLDLGGFDERYASGIGYDDNEFVVRVIRKGLKVGFVSHPLVLHQNHYSGKGTFENGRNRYNVLELSNKNFSLFNKTTLKEKTWRVNNEDSRI